VTRGDDSCLRVADRFLRAALAGRAARRPPLRFPVAGPFTRRVWEALLRIPPGRTLAYAELAVQAGSLAAARAAGTACGRNALPVFVPCHRVIGAGGALGGFSAGLAWKSALLRAEGARA